MRQTSTRMRGFAQWLPDILRDAGIDVYVMPGALTRSTWTSGFRLDAIVWHHTATGRNWADGHVAALLRDGRRDLKGPLSQVGIERDGTWVIVACGRANHNGAKSAKFGNDALGLEFYNSGTGEPWDGRQVESGVIGTAAVLDYAGDVPVVGHKESDPTRKIDPYGLSMDTIRARIRSTRDNLRVPIPVEEIDDDMAPFLFRFKNSNHVYLSAADMTVKYHVPNRTTLSGYQTLFAAKGWDKDVCVIDLGQPIGQALKNIPLVGKDPSKGAHTP